MCAGGWAMPQIAGCFLSRAGLLSPTLISTKAQSPQRQLLFSPPGGTYVGWSIGGGVEYAITQNLLGRVEYLYDHFGHKDYIGSDGDPYRVSLTGSTVRGALAWKF